MNHIQVPQQGPCEESCLFTRPFFILKFLIKISLNKEFFFLLSKALGRERPSMFPRSGGPMEICPIPELT
jgi:hypothetical protein